LAVALFYKLPKLFGRWVAESEYKVFTGWVRAVCLALILEPEGPMVFGDIPICQFQAGLPGQNVPPLIFKKFCLRVHYWDGLR
jgi:hypothetical protein